MSWLNAISIAVSQNGFEDVGLAGATDKGLEKKQYTVLPATCVRSVSLIGQITGPQMDRAVARVAHNAAADYKLADGDHASFKLDAHGPYIQIRPHGQNVTLYFDHAEQDAVTDGQIADFIRANKALVDSIATAGNNTEAEKGLIWAVFLQMYVFGHIDAGPGGEYTVIPNLNGVPGLNQQQITAIIDLSKTYAEQAKLLMSAAVINHFKINHTIGQGKVQGFVAKVLKTINMYRPAANLDDQGNAIHNEKVAQVMYQLLHRIGKRNGAWAIIERSPSSCAYFNRETGLPITFKTDEFVKLRTVGPPSGASKIYVACQVVKQMRGTGIVAFAPIQAEIPQLKAMREAVSKDPIAYHVGAPWYLAHAHPGGAANANQNSEVVQKVLRVGSIFIKWLAKTTTLARSPAFNDLYEQAANDFPSFGNACASLAEARDKVVDDNKIQTLISLKTTGAQIGAINTILADRANGTITAEVATQRLDVELDALVDGLGD